MDACAADLRCLIGAFHSRGGAAVCAIVAEFLAEKFQWDVSTVSSGTYVEKPSITAESRAGVNESGPLNP